MSKDLTSTPDTSLASLDDLTDPAKIITEALAFADTLIRNNGGFNLRFAVSVRGDLSWFAGKVTLADISSVIRVTGAEALLSIAHARYAQDASRELIVCTYHPRHGPMLVAESDVLGSAGEYAGHAEPKIERVDNEDFREPFQHADARKPTAAERRRVGRMLEDPEPLVCSALAQADFNMRANGGRMPAVANVRAGANAFVVPMLFDIGVISKHEAMQKLAELVCVTDAEDIMLVAESWAAPARCRIRASEHPERKEVLTAIFASRVGISVSAVADILRNPDGTYAGIGEIDVSQPMAYDRLLRVFDIAAELKMPRAEKRQMRREVMRRAIPLEQPAAN